ncbi:unnamed protein product [Adineta ricciae]|uniref:peptidylprolyl isomerase n=1 Tax=Adineta ricciae TaxID=249248 RepID=A0A814T892_ADIRI|nr:unnamed protein product [Adineta ricciae]CAF1259228.1 unnamed protein product [Adineta ricciae]
MPSKKKRNIPFDGEDITPTKDGCLYKQIVKENPNGEKSWFDDQVTIHYVGSLLDGTIFKDTREENSPLSFNLGRGEVIKAFDIAVETMLCGEISKFFSKPKYAYGLKGLPGKVDSAADVIFEIELISSKGKDISEERDESILRRIIKRGEGYEPANEDSIVEVNLKGSQNDEIFDERTVTFIMGAGIVEKIPSGIERTIFRMTKNEHDRIYLKNQAIEDLKRIFNLSSNETIQYDVILIKLERAKEERQLSDDQKLQQSEILKARADEFVKAGYYDLAAKRYRTVFHYLLNATLVSESDRQKSWELKFASQSNLALCYLKLGNYAECRRSCETALAHDKRHEKSHFRLGQCRLATRNYEQAVKDFETVLEINPSNVQAKQLIDECHRKIKEHRVDEKELYSSFFKKETKK